MPSKQCFKCKETLPLESFYAHKEMADGHLNKCKECAKKDVHEHRHGKGRERVLNYDRIRAKFDNRKEGSKRIIKAWNAKHPDRKKAQATLRNAMKTGKVNPMPCFCCGEKAEAHHPDYSAPLDVVWLCPAHHKQAHALARVSHV